MTNILELFVILTQQRTCYADNTNKNLKQMECLLHLKNNINQYMPNQYFCYTLLLSNISELLKNILLYYNFNDNKDNECIAKIFQLSCNIIKNLCLSDNEKSFSFTIFGIYGQNKRIIDILHRTFIEKIDDNSNNNNLCFCGSVHKYLSANFTYICIGVVRDDINYMRDRMNVPCYIFLYFGD